MATRTAAEAGIQQGWAQPYVPTWGRLTDVRFSAPIAALLILCLLVVLPLGTMLVASLRPPGTLPFDAAPFILSNFSSVFLAPDTLAMLRNTAIYASVPILLALPLAFGLAFLTERTDLPLRDAVYSAMFIPISIPVFASAMSWFLLLGRAREHSTCGSAPSSAWTPEKVRSTC
jgi:ABC-type Fe3+ transport system permease subunit